MSVGELIGLVVTISLLCAAITTAIILILTIRQDQPVNQHDPINKALEQWLASRLTLSRASLSFVMAFRSLASNSKDSPHYPLRIQEAQRVRGQWCDAMRELDRARASLIVHHHDPTIDDQLKDFDKIGAAELRRAINGNPEIVQQLRNQLDQLDRDSIQWVRSLVQPSAAQNFSGSMNRPAICNHLLQSIRYLRSIINHWNRF